MMGHASGGVLYGSHDRIGAARHYARNVGQQLQERAFNHLQVGEIATLREKVRLQGKRAALFVSALEARDWARTSSPAIAASGRDDWPARAIREVDGGCMVFLELPENLPDEKAAAATANIAGVAQRACPSRRRTADTRGLWLGRDQRALL